MALADAVSSAVAHWNLNESSGTRADSVGSNDLTDNATVGVTTGKFGNAADFVAANSEYLSITDNTDLSVAGNVDFMLRCWVNADDLSADRGIIGKWTSGASREYQLVYSNTDDRFRFTVRSSAGTITHVLADNLGSPSTGTDYLIHAWHDEANDVIGIAVNAGTANTASHTEGVNDAGADFTIGARLQGPLYWDGWIDDAVFLKGYILDATERSEDYNSGTGVAFEDWDAVSAKSSRLTLMGVS